MITRLLKSLYRFEQKYFGGLGLENLAVAQKIKALLFPMIYPSQVKFAGFDLELDPIYGFTDPEKYKPYIISFIQKNLRPGDVAVDLGANIGLLTLFMSRAVGRRGKVLAFEPGQRNLKLLRKNLSINGCNNVQVFEYAVGETNRPVFLPDRGAHNAIGEKETNRVKLVPLDDFLSKADLIKMDIIGSEPKALQGMRKLIAASPQLKIITAFCPAYIRKQGRDPLVFLADLHALGFSLEVSHNVDLPYSLDPEKFESLTQDYSKGIAQVEIICKSRQ